MLHTFMTKPFHLRFAQTTFVAVRVAVLANLRKRRTTQGQPEQYPSTSTGTRPRNPKFLTKEQRVAYWETPGRREQRMKEFRQEVHQALRECKPILN